MFTQLEQPVGDVGCKAMIAAGPLCVIFPQRSSFHRHPIEIAFKFLQHLFIILIPVQNIQAQIIADKCIGKGDIGIRFGFFPLRPDVC